MITIDQRECGIGKTTCYRTGIYNLVIKNDYSNTKTLIVVGSTELQHQYKTGLSKLGIDVFIVNHLNTDKGKIKPQITH